MSFLLPFCSHCEPCSERRKHLFVQDPQTCKCSCKNTDSRCKARQLELNERTCRLVSRGQARVREGHHRHGREREGKRERQREHTCEGPTACSASSCLRGDCYLLSCWGSVGPRAPVWPSRPALRWPWLLEWVGCCDLM